MGATVGEKDISRRRPSVWQTTGSLRDPQARTGRIDREEDDAGSDEEMFKR